MSGPAPTLSFPSYLAIIVAAISAFLVSILVFVYLRRRAYYIRLNTVAIAEMQAADALADAHLQGSGGASNIRPMGLRVRYDRFGFQEREVWDHFALGSLGEKDRPEMIEVEVGDKKSMLWPGELDELGEGGKADSVEAEGGAIVGSIMPFRAQLISPRLATTPSLARSNTYDPLPHSLSLTYLVSFPSPPLPQIHSCTDDEPLLLPEISFASTRIPLSPHTAALLSPLAQDEPERSRGTKWIRTGYRRSGLWHVVG